LRTKNIVLAPGAHLLPYHHPAELAHRVAFLDHMAQGRFMFGVGSSGLPSDWKLFNVDGFGGEHRRMTREALEIILQLWASEEPFEYKGEFWTVNRIDTMLETLKFHIKPYQQPHPPIGIAGVTPGSDTLKIAGEHGFMPMSLNISPTYLASHWQAVCEGAAKAGRTPHRRDWRVVREVYVAETDAEARQKAVHGMLGRAYREYFLPLLGSFGFIPFFKHDPNLPDTDVTPEYLVDHGWLVGSPATVTAKLRQMYEDAGGFGCLLVLTFDHVEDREGWANSQRLLAEEVMPHVADLMPD
jgi:alkanesulfonate monooxygenase SsuD/methylene tetrahydromethanopterin reductase-like flavin-dependent oxidoreductase (luciferase family)